MKELNQESFIFMNIGLVPISCKSSCWLFFFFIFFHTSLVTFAPNFSIRHSHKNLSFFPFNLLCLMSYLGITSLQLVAKSLYIEEGDALQCLHMSKVIQRETLSFGIHNLKAHWPNIYKPRVGPSNTDSFSIFCSHSNVNS